jgi:hypothetical protein
MCILKPQIFVQNQGVAQARSRSYEAEYTTQSLAKR